MSTVAGTSPLSGGSLSAAVAAELASAAGIASSAGMDGGRPPREPSGPGRDREGWGSSAPPGEGSPGGSPATEDP